MGVRGRERGVAGMVVIMLLMTCCCYTKAQTTDLLVVEVLVGGEASLPCPPPPNRGPPTLITFLRTQPAQAVLYRVDLRPGGPTHWAARGYESRAFVRVGRRWGGPKEHTLQLDTTTLQDRGQYQCHLHYKDGTDTRHIFTLEVVDPPKMLRVYSDLGANTEVKGSLGPLFPGDQVTLSCRVTGGQPRPNVTWWSGSQLLVNSSCDLLGSQVTQCDLSLGPVTYDDLGRQLTCRATNSDVTSSLEQKVLFDVHYAPQVWIEMTIKKDTRDGGKENDNTMQNGGEIKTGAKTHTTTKMKTDIEEKTRTTQGTVKEIIQAREGDGVVIKCYVTASPPATSVIWTRDNHTVPVEHQHPAASLTSSAGSIQVFQLQYPKVSRSGHQGVYRCQVTNQVAEVTSAPVSLQVKDAVQGVSWCQVSESSTGVYITQVLCSPSGTLIHPTYTLDILHHSPTDHHHQGEPLLIHKGEPQGEPLFNLQRMKVEIGQQYVLRVTTRGYQGDNTIPLTFNFTLPFTPSFTHPLNVPLSPSSTLPQSTRSLPLPSVYAHTFADPPSSTHSNLSSPSIFNSSSSPSLLALSPVSPLISPQSATSSLPDPAPSSSFPSASHLSSDVNSLPSTSSTSPSSPSTYHESSTLSHSGSPSYVSHLYTSTESSSLLDLLSSSPLSSQTSSVTLIISSSPSSISTLSVSSSLPNESSTHSPTEVGLTASPTTHFHTPSTSLPHPHVSTQPQNSSSPQPSSHYSSSSDPQVSKNSSSSHWNSTSPHNQNSTWSLSVNHTSFSHSLQSHSLQSTNPSPSPAPSHPSVVPSVASGVVLLCLVCLLAFLVFMWRRANNNNNNNKEEEKEHQENWELCKKDRAASTSLISQVVDHHCLEEVTNSFTPVRRAGSPSPHDTPLPPSSDTNSVVSLPRDPEMESLLLSPPSIAPTVSLTSLFSLTDDEMEEEEKEEDQAEMWAKEEGSEGEPRHNDRKERGREGKRGRDVKKDREERERREEGYQRR